MAELSGSSAVSIDHWSTPPGSPRADWDDLVRTNISRCDLMIVIVGSKSAYCEGIRNELRFAKRSNVPFFGIYAPGGSPEMSLLTICQQTASLVGNGQISPESLMPFWASDYEARASIHERRGRIPASRGSYLEYLCGQSQL
jgi:hypothetical protein